MSLNKHVCYVCYVMLNVQKGEMHVQSCCFANLTYSFFAVLVDVTVVIA